MGDRPSPKKSTNLADLFQTIGLINQLESYNSGNGSTSVASSMLANSPSWMKSKVKSGNCSTVHQDHFGPKSSLSDKLSSTCSEEFF